MSEYENRLLLIWLSYTAVMISGLIPLIIWAIKSGQFSNNDKMKYLPLKNLMPEDEGSNNV